MSDKLKQTKISLFQKYIFYLYFIKTYRISSNKRLRRLLNFESARCGAC